tara:strand:- start:4043 stop:4600 length:558 start_codon:yes stop_codon:yes gene_type:complete
MDKWKSLKTANITSRRSDKLLDNKFNNLKREIKFSSEYIVIILLIKMTLLLLAMYQFLKNNYPPAINITVFVASICSFLFYLAYVRNMLKKSEKERQYVGDLKRHVQSAKFLFLGAICGIISSGLLFISILVSASSTEKLSTIVIKGIGVAILLVTACFEMYNMYSASRKNAKVKKNVLNNWKKK